MNKANIVYYQRLNELIEVQTPFVTITMTAVRGSAPQEVGAKAIITLDGIDTGTVGGGKIEAHCINVAQDFLTGKRLPDHTNGQHFTWNLQKDIGMTCGGEVSFFFDIVKPSKNWNIAIFGAGHVSQELTRLLLKLNCHLTVIDDRVEWVSKLPENNNYKKILCDQNYQMKDVLKELPNDTFVAIMTMGHSTDVPILLEAIKNHHFPYLGVIGSKSKKNRMFQKLEELGASKDELSKIICPIGEDFGDNTPIEISLSIAAQLLKKRESL